MQFWTKNSILEKKKINFRQFNFGRNIVGKKSIQSLKKSGKIRSKIFEF